jgi:outer membrane lipoprotein-sorting protein
MAFGIALANAQDAADIMDKARNRLDEDSMGSQARMVITRKKGDPSERVINMYTKDDAKGNSRTMIEFLSPSSVKGTRFLTMDKGDGDSDQWIYLPELNKVRRIAASESGGSFMGTDFSYDDISLTNRDSKDDNHKYVRDDTITVDGASKNCYMIESTPKDSDYQYSKVISWVDKANYCIYKADMYDDKGKVVKHLDCADFQTRQGNLTPIQTKISTLADGTSTTINLDRVQYNMNIPEAVFTPRYLETGKAR